jgi:hypothetical protein
MGQYRQFLGYKLSPKAGGRTEKKPINIKTGMVSSPTDPSSWYDFGTASSAVSSLGPEYGVGFCFTDSDPFWFLDIDHCLTDTGWSPIARRMLDTFKGAAVEVSSSGQGLHLFGCGRAPHHSCRNASLGLEFYTSKRFVALTGMAAEGDVSTDHTHALSIVIPELFPATSVDDVTPLSQLSDRPVSEWSGHANDDALVKRAVLARSAKASLGLGASFEDLWHNNIDALRQAFPAMDSQQGYDASRADAALASHLAWWTGKHGTRMLTLMLQSGLAREKWNRPDYLPRTINNAIAKCKTVHTNTVVGPLLAPVQKTVNYPSIGKRSGDAFCGLDDQIELFKGCVYVTEQHAIMDIRTGALLSPEQFRVAFGGYEFTFAGKTSRDPWQVFTQSQDLRFPRADGRCFRPNLDTGSMITDGGRTRVNTYVEIDVPRVPGDPAPFLAHLEKILPNHKDQQIILAYMAACVQHKGAKFKWTPLIQGVEGNGKSTLSRCLREAIGRQYCHSPRADQLAAKFNAWMYGKLLITVEDIHVAEDAATILEALKPMITETTMALEAKGVDSITEEVCCNFFITTNHKDAVRKSRNDRRIAVFYCGQQAKADLARDGLTHEYFRDLHEWLEGPEQGFAIVSDFLHTYNIPIDLNPATGCLRAPDTSSQTEVIAHNSGRLEQELEEAIDRGDLGMRGGWLSGHQVSLLFGRLGSRLAPNKQKELITGMGYIPHPGLANGRTNNTTLIDGVKTVLYVKPGSKPSEVTGGSNIANQYAEDQNSY